MLFFFVLNDFRNHLHSGRAWCRLPVLYSTCTHRFSTTIEKIPKIFELNYFRSRLKSANHQSEFSINSFESSLHEPSVSSLSNLVFVQQFYYNHTRANAEFPQWGSCIEYDDLSNAVVCADWLANSGEIDQDQQSQFDSSGAVLPKEFDELHRLSFRWI